MLAWLQPHPARPGKTARKTGEGLIRAGLRAPAGPRVPPSKDLRCQHTCQPSCVNIRALLAEPVAEGRNKALPPAWLWPNVPCLVRTSFLSAPPPSSSLRTAGLEGVLRGTCGSGLRFPLQSRVLFFFCFCLEHPELAPLVPSLTDGVTKAANSQVTAVRGPTCVSRIEALKGTQRHNHENQGTVIMSFSLL